MNYFKPKQSLIVLLVIAFIITMLSSSILAKDVYDMVDEYNQRIEDQVAYSQAKAEEVLSRDDTEEEINSEIEEIIDELLYETDEIAAETIDEAAELGYEVECSYEEVNIAGQTVLIDPLIVLAD